MLTGFLNVGVAMDPFLACEAIRLGRRVQLSYDGHDRLVEIHTVGRSREGRAMMNVWQVSGGSVSNAPVGWKMMHLDKVRNATITDEQAEVPREKYTEGASQFDAIQCEVASGGTGHIRLQTPSP